MEGILMASGVRTGSALTARAGDVPASGLSAAIRDGPASLVKNPSIHVFTS